MNRHDEERVRAIDAALVEAALEERLGGAAPPDLAAAILSAAGVPAAKRASGWWWVAAAVALVLVGAGLGHWWRNRSAAGAAEPQSALPHDAPHEGEHAVSERTAETDAERTSEPDVSGPGEHDAGNAKADAAPSAGSEHGEFYVPRDAADARRVLSVVDTPDVQFHFVGPHRLPTASVSGPPSPVLRLGQWAYGKALALGMARALEQPRLLPDFDPSQCTFTIFVRTGERRMRLALFEGALWVDGLGTFATDFECRERLAQLELEVRRRLGLIHRDELGEGLPNALIPAEQTVLRPFGLFPEDVVKLAGLRRLETLDLRWCDAGHTEPFVRAVSALGSVQKLWLRELTDATLPLVARLDLRELVVLAPDEAPWRAPLRAACAGVTEASLHEVRRLTELETLVLPGCRASRAALADVAVCRRLRVLVLAGARAAGDAPLWRSFAGHARLEELRLAGSDLARADDLADLAGVRTLQELDLDGCAAAFGARAAGSEGRGIAQGAEARRSDPADAERRAALAALATYPSLRRVSLGGWFTGAIDAEDRRALVDAACAPALRWLSLPDCPGLRAEDLLALSRARQLETLVLSGTVGDEGGRVRIEELGPLFDALPGLTVITD